MPGERQNRLSAHDLLKTIRSIFSPNQRGEDGIRPVEIKIKNTFDRMIREKVRRLLDAPVSDRYQSPLIGSPEKSLHQNEIDHLLEDIESYLDRGNYEAILELTQEQQGPIILPQKDRVHFRAYAYEQIAEQKLSRSDLSEGREAEARSVIHYLDSLNMTLRSDPYDIQAQQIQAKQSLFFKMKFETVLSLSQSEKLAKILSLLTDLGYQESVKEIEKRFFTAQRPQITE